MNNHTVGLLRISRKRLIEAQLDVEKSMVGEPNDILLNTVVKLFGALIQLLSLIVAVHDSIRLREKKEDKENGSYLDTSEKVKA